MSDRVKSSDAMRQWLASDGFAIFCELKHGPVGLILTMLQDGRISRGRAAEAIAELLVAEQRPLPAAALPEFADDEIPAEVCARLRRALTKIRDLARAGRLDEIWTLANRALTPSTENPQQS